MAVNNFLVEVKVWSTFVATGNPNCEALLPLTWEPVNGNDSPFK